MQCASSSWSSINWHVEMEAKIYVRSPMYLTIMEPFRHDDLVRPQLTEETFTNVSIKTLFCSIHIAGQEECSESNH